MKNILICLLAMGTVWLTSCSSLPVPKTTKNYRLAPTQKGVRTAPSGTAVLEISMPVDVVFDELEGYLSKDMTITMSKRNAYKLDANNMRSFYEFDLMPLTTGKTGITIYAAGNKDGPLDPYLARRMGDELVDILNRPVPKKKLPLKVDEVEPRPAGE